MNSPTITLGEPEMQRWEDIREFRNFGAHPDFQRVGPPGEAVFTLRSLARSIDQVLGFT